MRAFGAFIALLVGLGLASCSGTEQRAYGKEAAGAALEVGSLGAQRAATKDCWIRCGEGYVCNLESGSCERGECVPSCESGSHCVRDTRSENHCVLDSNGTRGSVHLSSAPPDAGI